MLRPYLRPRPHLILLIGVFSVSWAAIFVRFCEAPAMVIAAYRLGFSAILIVPYFLIQKGKGLKSPQLKEGLLLFLSGTFLAFHFFFWIGSIQLISIATAVVLSSTHPIFVAFLSYLLLKKGVSGAMLFGIVLSLFGVLLMGLGSFNLKGQGLLGHGMAILAAIMISGYFIIGKYLRKDMDLISYITPTYATAALLLVLACLVSKTPLFGYSAKTYLMLGLLAAVPTIIGHSSLNWSLRYVSATLVALAVLGEPVGATFLAIFILKEIPVLPKVISSMIILLGIFIASRAEMERIY